MNQKVITFDVKLLEEIPNYDSSLMVKFFEAYSKDKIALFKEKDKQYGGSWQKDGFLGAYMNLKRKIDRVISQFKNGNLTNFTEDSTGETSIDTFMDLDNYSGLNLAYLFFTCDSTDAYMSFCKKVPTLSQHFQFKDGRVQPLK